VISEVTTYIISFSFAFLISLFSSFLVFVKYKETKLINYIYLLLLFGIGAFVFALSLLGSILCLVSLNQIAVFSMTFALIPLYLFTRKVVSRRPRLLLDVVYLSIVAIKVYDLSVSRSIFVQSDSILMMEKARGMLGSFMLMLEFFILVSLVTYIVVGSIVILGYNRAYKLFYILLISSVFISVSATIFLLTGFKVSSIYLILMSLYWIQIALLFSYSPLMTSLLLFKLRGYALIEKDRTITFYKVRVREDESLFLLSIRSLLNRLGELIPKPTKIRVNCSDFIILPVLNRYLILYGRELDFDIARYFDFIVKKSIIKKGYRESFFEDLII